VSLAESSTGDPIALREAVAELMEEPASEEHARAALDAAAPPRLPGALDCLAQMVEATPDTPARSVARAAVTLGRVAALEPPDAERLAAVGQVAATVAHELRNPLNVINSAAYLLRRRVADRPEVHRTLDTLNVYVERCNRIVSELLSFSGSPEPVHTAVDLNHLVEESLDHSTVPEAVTLVTRLASDLPPVRGDRDLLEQVFTNILQNALQAVGEGGRVTVTTAPTDSGRIYWCVEDTGEGIAPENIERIWQPLFTTRARGTGLGLAIVKRILDRHDADLKVESVPGAGSRFEIHLPVWSGDAPA
jgi:signal transduction histidine kinase